MAKITAYGDRPLYRLLRVTHPDPDMDLEMELVITVQGRVLRKHRTRYHGGRTNKWSGYSLVLSGLRESERVMYIRDLRDKGWQELRE